MRHEYRFAAAPKWAAGHVVVLALAVTMVLLGRWQLDVSDSKHFSLQNFGYALQWWAFSLFAVGMWLRILRDAARGRASASGADESPPSQPVGPAAAAPEPVAYRRYLMPQSSDAPAVAEDSEHAAYNEYLARLAEPAREERT